MGNGVARNSPHHFDMESWYMARLKSFDEVFENKLEKLRKRITKELEKTPKERNKHFVKTLLKEAKALRKMLKND